MTNKPSFTKPPAQTEKRIPAGFARCWACNRIVRTYQHVGQSVITGKAITEKRFKKHIAPKLREFARAGFTVTSIWCIKSNTFAV